MGISDFHTSESSKQVTENKTLCLDKDSFTLRGYPAADSSTHYFLHLSTK